MSRRLQVAVAGLAILLAAFIVHMNVLFPRDPAAIYPWSSDQWGHLIKAEYLRQKIGEGAFYPNMFPAWYGGQQMLRYFAPLPYYLLVGLYAAVDNIWVAGNLYLFLTSAAGALGFLLFSRRIGLVPATLGGLFYLILPDNLRVAYAEGNLPRLLANALLPYAAYFVINLLTAGTRRRDFAGVVVTTGLIVLSHAMMAGIFVLGFIVLVIAYWLIARCSVQVVLRAGLALTCGLLISAWWLIPSLQGGITEIDQAAASEAVASFPPSVAFNPALRSGDQEIFYVGLALIAVALVTMIKWRMLEPWHRAVLVAGLVMGLVASTLLNDVWKALPFNNLLWPMRFMGFAGFALVLSASVFVGVIYRTYGALAGHATRGRLARLAAAAIVVVLFIDAEPSLSLAHGRTQPEEIVRTAEALRELPGWRVATADQSRLGSAPSQLLTSVGGRDQVFGWAYQGSTIAPLLAHINEGIARDHSIYAVSRLERLGTDDVIVAEVPEIGKTFLPELEKAGFREAMRTDSLRLYHRDGRPRAALPPTTVLGIGLGANNAAYLFPEVLVGSSPAVDDYDPQFLDQFDVLVLSRFTYRSRGAAEKLVRDFAASGKRVLVDLTGAPIDPLAREPRFLGVYGEPALGITRARVNLDGATRLLRPFPEKVGEVAIGEWRGVAAQGAEEDLVLFEYPATNGTLVGRNRYGDGSVDFLGLNLLFHAAVTRDPLAVQILERELGRPAFTRPADESVELENYQSDEDGFRFAITLEHPAWVLLPMGRPDGTIVAVDGVATRSVSVESLTLTPMPAGRSQVSIEVVPTPAYFAGRVATGVAVLVLLAYLVRGIPAHREPPETASRTVASMRTPPMRTARRARRVATRLLIVAMALSAMAVAGIVGSSPGLADSTLASDGFEDGFAGGRGRWHTPWSLSGDAAVVAADGPHSRKWHLRLRRATGTAVRPVDAGGYDHVRIQFWAKAAHFEARDTATVSVVGDDGIPLVLHTWVDGKDDNVYHFFDLAVPESHAIDGLQIEFDAEMDGTTDQLYVDDLAVSGSGGDDAQPPLPSPPPPPPPDSFGQIALDSRFDDWSGMPHLDDPFEDTNKQHADLHQFYWANVADEGANYWMIVRHTKDAAPFDGQNGHHEAVTHYIHLDTNDNGSYSDDGDRTVRVEYAPRNGYSRVTVSVRAGQEEDDEWEVVHHDQDWGDSEQEGGLRVELRVPWSYLGLSFGQPIRMFVSSDEDRLPDSGDVQWSPASILGLPVLALAFVIGIGAVWYLAGRRQWRPG